MDVLASRLRRNLCASRETWPVERLIARFSYCRRSRLASVRLSPGFTVRLQDRLSARSSFLPITCRSPILSLAGAFSDLVRKGLDRLRGREYRLGLFTSSVSATQSFQRAPSSGPSRVLGILDLETELVQAGPAPAAGVHCEVGNRLPGGRGEQVLDRLRPLVAGFLNRAKKLPGLSLLMGLSARPCASRLLVLRSDQVLIDHQRVSVATGIVAIPSVCLPRPGFTAFSSSGPDGARRERDRCHRERGWPSSCQPSWSSSGRIIVVTSSSEDAPALHRSSDRRQREISTGSRATGFALANSRVEVVSPILRPGDALLDRGSNPFSESSVSGVDVGGQVIRAHLLDLLSAVTCCCLAVGLLLSRMLACGEQVGELLLSSPCLSLEPGRRRLAPLSSIVPSIDL